MLGCSSSSPPATENTSPCLGALTSPSFRSAGHHPSGKCFTSVCQPQHQPSRRPRPRAPLWLTGLLCFIPLPQQVPQDHVLWHSSFSKQVMRCPRKNSSLVWFMPVKKPFRQPKTSKPCDAARAVPWYLPGVISSALSSPFPLTHWPPRLKIQFFPNNSKAFPQLLWSQLGGKPRGCFCKDRTPTVSQSIIRHLSKLQRIQVQGRRE